MSTQRYISTSFWDDAWIQELDPSEKLLYIYLLTNPLTNIAGVYKLTRKRMVFDTGFNSDTVGHILDKFEKANKVWVCGEYVIIRSWTKHQKWESSDKVKKGIDAILLELPKEVLIKCAEIEYTYDLKKVFDTLCIPYTYSTNYLDLNLNIDLNKDKEESQVSTCADVETTVDKVDNLPAEAKDCAVLLYSLHKQQDSKYTVTDSKLKAWAQDIDKLNRLDGRDWQEIREVIEWAKQANNFWFPNIMSGKKLREKFPTLISQMKRPAGGAHSMPYMKNDVYTGEGF